MKKQLTILLSILMIGSTFFLSCKKKDSSSSNGTSGPAGSLSVLVMDTTSPVQQAVVKLASSADNRTNGKFDHVAATNASGIALFSNLPVQTWYVYAYKSDLDGYANQAITANKTTQITISIAATGNLRVTVAAGTNLGQHIVGADVYLYPSLDDARNGTNLIGQTQTDQLGKAYFNGIAVGTYGLAGSDGGQKGTDEVTVKKAKNSQDYTDETLVIK